LKFLDRTLSRVDVSGDQIGDRGVEILAEICKLHGDITTVGLRNSRISEKGVSHLAEALTKDQAITDLDISYNDIGNEGINSLTQMVQHNRVLTRLDLSRMKEQGNWLRQSRSKKLSMNSALVIIISVTEEQRDWLTHLK